MIASLETTIMQWYKAGYISFRCSHSAKDHSSDKDNDDVDSYNIPKHCKGGESFRGFFPPFFCVNDIILMRMLCNAEHSSTRSILISKFYICCYIQCFPIINFVCVLMSPNHIVLFVFYFLGAALHIITMITFP